MLFTKSAFGQVSNSLIRLSETNPDVFLSTIFLYLNDRADAAYKPTDEELFEYIKLNAEVGDYKEAEEWGDSLVKRTFSGIVRTEFDANVARELGRIKTIQTKFDEALELYTDVLEFHQSLNDKPNIATDLIDIAEFQRSIFNQELGLTYIEKAKRVFDDTIYPPRIYARLLGREAALIQEASGNETEVERLSREALKIGETIGDSVIVATACNELGYVLVNGESPIFFKRAISIWHKLGRRLEEFHSTLNLARWCRDNDRLNYGIVLAESVLQASLENEWYSEAWMANEFLAGAYALDGDYKKSSLHVSDALHMAIRLQENRHSRQLRIALARNEATLAQSELELQKAAFNRVNIELRNKQLERNFILSIAIGISLTLLIVFYLYRKITKINHSLSAQKTNSELLNIELKATLTQRETLIQEVHHRVKNNLQIISSILNMQAKAEVDASTVSSIKKAQQRVRSIAMIHEKLYQTESLSSINFREYLIELTDQIKHAVTSDAFRLNINVNADNSTLSIDYAIPLGLIVNEIVTNSIKYAFPNRSEGMVEINFKEIGIREFQLTVSDNGIGFKLEEQKSKTGSLGRNLIDLLLRQLRAVYEVHVENGTQYVIHFNSTA